MGQTLAGPCIGSIGWSMLWLLALTLSAGGVQAHPHGWIDVQSRILLDDQGRVEAVDLAWLFDEWYTTVVAEEFPGADKTA